MMKSVFIENNFKLRIDGIVFLKNYFSNFEDIEKLTKTDRFNYLYLPELLGYLEDGDQQLVCDAIVAATPLLEFLEEEVIVKIFLPQLLHFFCIKQHTTQEITEAIARNIGIIAYRLNNRNFLKPHRQEFAQFFRELIEHKEINIRMFGVFNLPCFHVLFREDQEQYDLNFA